VLPPSPRDIVAEACPACLPLPFWKLFLPGRTLLPFQHFSFALHRDRGRSRCKAPGYKNPCFLPVKRLRGVWCSFHLIPFLRIVSARPRSRRRFRRSDSDGALSSHDFLTPLQSPLLPFSHYRVLDCMRLLMLLYSLKALSDSTLKLFDR